MSGAGWPIVGALVVAVACARQGSEKDATAGAPAGAAVAGDSMPPVAARDSARDDAAAKTTDTSRFPLDTEPAAAARPARPPAAATRPPARVTVTMRGTVRVVGSSPFSRVVLASIGGRAVTLTGPDSATLRRAAATDVEVRGTPSDDGRELEVADFTVVSANGGPALDGTLVRDGDGLALETATRLVRLGNPPEPLRQQVGARVWLGGPPGTGPNPFGILVPAP